MTTLRQAWARLVSFFRKDALDRELDEELVAHIDLATADNIRRGMSAPDARRIALARLGGIEPSKQLHRESRGLESLDGLVQDVRYAARSLRRSPGFTLTAVLTLAIGIGVNTAVFTVMNAVLFKGFPLVRDNDRVLYITTNRSAVYYPDFADWRALAKSFEGMALVRGVFKTLNGEGDVPETYFATEATADIFKVLGVKPILGRDFTPSDAQPGAAPVVMLRYDLWERRFGKDPAIIGRAVRLSGVPTTVIGVMPPGFSFPENQNLWTPLVPTPAALRRDTFYARYTFGRMADGVTRSGGPTHVLHAVLQRRRGHHADIGVSTANVLTTSLYIPHDRYPSGEAQISFYQRLETRVEALPGVESVAIGSVAPTEYAGAPRPYELSGVPPIDERRRPTVPNLVVSPDYFRTLGAAVLSGRGFNDFDRASSVPVAIVNEQFARRNWPGEDPLGKRLRLFEGEARGAWRTVVGVVSDIVQNDPTRQEFGPLVYVPYDQRPAEYVRVCANSRCARKPCHRVEARGQRDRFRSARSCSHASG